LFGIEDWCLAASLQEAEAVHGVTSRSISATSTRWSSALASTGIGSSGAVAEDMKVKAGCPEWGNESRWPILYLVGI
jgi:hypothetical protein